MYEASLSADNVKSNVWGPRQSEIFEDTGVRNKYFMSS